MTLSELELFRAPTIGEFGIPATNDDRKLCGGKAGTARREPGDAVGVDAGDANAGRFGFGRGASECRSNDSVSAEFEFEFEFELNAELFDANVTSSAAPPREAEALRSKILTVPDLSADVAE